MCDFNLLEFDKYRENNRMEAKSAKGGLPKSLWETYSAFANSYGGIIILGISEKDDGSFETSGLQNADKILKEFWNQINNRKKVSINLLKDKDVKIYDIGRDQILVIRVPAAKREFKPVYINDDLFGGTFRRNHEGDYHCTSLQVKIMLRDQTENTADMQTLDNFTIDCLNSETLKGYRNRHRAAKPGHPFIKLEDQEYLRSIGAAAVSESDGKLHPTAAGLLMFGNEYDIIRQFPDYFLDYREVLDSSIRWNDRVNSSSGDWSGNLCDFFFRICGKLVKDLKIPFRTKGMERIDDTPLHVAIREALVNCLVNSDYYGLRGVVIKKESDLIVFENPGYSRIGIEQMRLGGVSDPRNKSLMKMFNLINIGERAGSGIPNIFSIWKAENFEDPVIKEEFDPDRTIFSLSFRKKENKNEKSENEKSEREKSDNTKPENERLKTGSQEIEKSGNRDENGFIRLVSETSRNIKLNSKTLEKRQQILKYLSLNITGTTSEISEVIELSMPRTRVILREMAEDELIISEGANKNRSWKLIEKIE